MRNLTFKRLFVKEELETVLRNYPDFLEGGARIEIEEGRYPTLHEIALKIVIHKKEDDVR